MNFEDLQKSWRSQPLEIPGDSPMVVAELERKWQKQQKGVLWANVRTTVGFAAVFVNFAWIYHSFNSGRTIFFSLSLALMVLLMLVYLGVIWKGYAMKKIDLSIAGNEYISRYLQTLRWRRKTFTFYSWVYAVLLFLALMCYFYDVLAGTSLWVRIGAPVATGLYVFGVTYFTGRRARRKRLPQIDELITSLEKMQEECGI